MNVDFIDMLDGYKAENDELLQKMEDALLVIKEEGMSDETINAVFRAAHTIKGSSGMFGIDYIVEFTHSVENLLDKVRNHKIVMTDAMIELMLACKDHMQALVDFVMSTPEGALEEDLRAQSQSLLKGVAGFLEPHPAPQSLDQKYPDPKALNVYRIEVSFDQALFQEGHDPLTFIAYLREIAVVNAIKTYVDDIPSFCALNPKACYISYMIEVATDKPMQMLLDAFSFAKNHVKVAITPLDAHGVPIEEATTANDTMNEVEKRAEIAPLKAPQTVQATVVKTPSTAPANAVKTTHFIRIDAEKIDTLINLIGEMVISNAAVMQQARESKNSTMMESVSTVSHMLEEIRENAMQIRMVPIGDSFNKFKRIIHDTANKIGKKVELIISGADTELDKTVIEKIADPLVHLIRNAIDHGIEAPDARKAAGKQESGILELKAYHDTGSIAIEIIDDGKGLDEEVLIAKAIEKGMIEPNEVLTQREIFNLILKPGFSTAKEVSDISGRGVGMDVVQRNISELRGTIDIQSTKGKGTRITIHLPLTLAIIDGFLTKVAQTHFIIPLDMVIECIELSSKVSAQLQKNNYINLRGSILPILNTAHFFRMKSAPNRRNNIIVVSYGAQKMGILVDELLGELQTVIKPMGAIFKNVHTFSGSTILGSGEMALIMDIPVLLQSMEHTYAKAS